MPIEIKELNIKINVNDSSETNSADNDSLDETTQEDIVSQCVEQVLEIISKKLER